MAHPGAGFFKLYLHTHSLSRLCIQEPFHNYFELFLKQKFKNPRRLIEVAVNILESLKKYAFDR